MHNSDHKYQFNWSDKQLEHLSVGAVIVNEEGKILVHRLGRIENKIFLPKKTHAPEVTLEQTLARTNAETGWEIEIERFLGVRISHFGVPEQGLTIRKATIWFLCKPVKEIGRDKEDRDADSELLWLNREEAEELYAKQSQDTDIDERDVLKWL